MLRKLKDFDFTLIITPLILTGFGIVMVYSASMVIAVVEKGFASDYYFIRQIQWFGVGLIGFVFCTFFPYKNYQRLTKLMIIGIIILLVAVRLFGDVGGNAKSWLSLGPINIQPSEFAKLAIIIYLASVYSKKQSYINNFGRGVLPPLILTAIILLLIVIQPDIGTAAIIFLIACSVIFSSGIRFKHLFLLVAMGLLLVALAIPNMITDERVGRFIGAYQPFEVPSDDGFQLIQSYLAIGLGGISGEGLGQSVQKLGYLYGPHTDFIISIIAEELGFIGVAIVIGAIATIVLRGIFISRKCEDSFGALLAIGVSSMIGIQAFINLGSATGILPITGVTLPFVSYGGSSLLVLLTSAGILNNIAMSVKKKEQEPRAQDENTIPETEFYNKGGTKWSS